MYWEISGNFVLSSFNMQQEIGSGYMCAKTFTIFCSTYKENHIGDLTCVRSVWVLVLPNPFNIRWLFKHMRGRRRKGLRLAFSRALEKATFLIWCVWILYHHYPGTKKPIPSSGGQSYVVNNTNTIQQRVAPPIMRKTLQKNSPFPFLHGQTNISSELLNVSSWIGNTQRTEQTDFEIK